MWGDGGGMGGDGITCAAEEICTFVRVSSSSTKPTMTKENFTKFLNEKQRDSRLNEELFPRLRQDQIKALIDKYEPCASNTNRSEARCRGRPCRPEGGGGANASACRSFQVSFLPKAS